MRARIDKSFAITNESAVVYKSFLMVVFLDPIAKMKQRLSFGTTTPRIRARRLLSFICSPSEDCFHSFVGFFSSVTNLFSWHEHCLICELNLRAFLALFNLILFFSLECKTISVVCCYKHKQNFQINRQTCWNCTQVPFCLWCGHINIRSTLTENRTNHFTQNSVAVKIALLRHQCYVFFAKTLLWFNSFLPIPGANPAK